MIINALCDYYDLLARDEESGISQMGYQDTNVSYEAVLFEDGQLMDIISYLEINDKKPKTFKMPLSMKSTGIAASPVCDNFAYIFGISSNKGSKDLEPVKFEAAKKLHTTLFQNASSREARAILQFFQTWDIHTAWENPHILKYFERGNSYVGNIVFSLVGEGRLFHTCREIVDIWHTENQRKKTDFETVNGLCGITGKTEPLARIHTQLSGVKGASPMGASLVCFKKDSDKSYNLDQSYNARMGETAAFKYTTVLNKMLAGTGQKLFVGDDTTVYWASSTKKAYAEVFHAVFGFEDDEGDESVEHENRVFHEQIKSILKNGKQGIYQMPELDPDTKFYVLGLAPNAGRVSVRYFLQDSFGGFCDKLKQHDEDMRICGQKDHIKLSSMLYATISVNSTDKKCNPLLGGAVMRSILTGCAYPQLLFNQTILRIKTERSVGQARAAILKGCIVRKNRVQKKEEYWPMYLNKESQNPAYVLGRTFSLLEMIQRHALGDINATIKDKFFASACSTPALVFPNLIKLSQHHLAKMEDKNKTYWGKQLGQCLGLLESDSFPKTLNMENQGRFILGYYQQTQANYQKKEQTNEDS